MVMFVIDNCTLNLDSLQFTLLLPSVCEGAATSMAGGTNDATIGRPKGKPKKVAVVKEATASPLKGLGGTDEADDVFSEYGAVLQGLAIREYYESIETE